MFHAESLTLFATTQVEITSSLVPFEIQILDLPQSAAKSGGTSEPNSQSFQSYGASGSLGGPSAAAGGAFFGAVADSIYGPGHNSLYGGAATGGGGMYGGAGGVPMGGVVAGASSSTPSMSNWPGWVRKMCRGRPVILERRLAHAQADASEQFVLPGSALDSADRVREWRATIRTAASVSSSTRGGSSASSSASSSSDDVEMGGVAKRYEHLER